MVNDSHTDDIENNNKSDANNYEYVINEVNENDDNSLDFKE